MSDSSLNARALNKALTSKKIDDDSIIQISVTNNRSQREAISEQYQQLFNKPLLEDIQAHTGGNFRETLLGLYTPLIDYDCQQLRKSVKGLGTDEKSLIEILVTRSSDDLERIRNRYPEIFPGRDLVKDVEDDTSGHFKDLLVSLISGKRSKNNSPDYNSCKKDATALAYAFEHKNEEAQQKIITEIFTLRSKKELEVIISSYSKAAGKDILKGIQAYFGGDVYRTLEGIIYAILSPSEYYAKRINESIVGLGTDDTSLVRVLVTRFGIDLHEIKQYYRQNYKTEISTDIKGDTSGSYQKLLVAIANY